MPPHLIKKPLDLAGKPRLLILAIALMTILFFIGGPDYHSSRSFKSVWNLGHIAYFAVLPLLLIQFTPLQRIRSSILTIVLLLLTLGLGASIEWLQYGVGRTPDPGDMFRNLIGAGIAICFLLPGRNSLVPTWRRFAMIILMALTAAQCIPVCIAVIDEHHARRNFPMLSDFQTPWQTQRWAGGATITRTANVGDEGNWAMRADLTTQQYSGCNLKYFPGDWQGYRWFQFRIYNPSDNPITITCRIHDQIHTQGIQRHDDRFNKTYSLKNGWNTITVFLAEVQEAPVTRRMDLGRIYGVGIFASRLPYPRTIYVDDVRLW